MSDGPNAHLFFVINYPFDVTLNNKLYELSSLKFWDKGKKEYVYVFPMKHYDTVVSLTKGVFFDATEVKVANDHTYIKRDNGSMVQWQGKSGYEVTEYTNMYVITEYQKTHKDAKPREITHQIPKERVRRIWESVFSKLDKNQSYGFEYLAKKVCKEFELTRYFRDKSGTFDKEKFQGTRPSGDYGKFYYYGTKVLEYYKLIERRGQWITRIADEWPDQGTWKH